jgi:hypothetical protein
MIEYRTSPEPPHLTIHLSGTVSEDDVHGQFQEFEDVLATLPSGYVALVDCLEPTYLTPTAAGPLYYHAVQALDTDPGLTVLLYGERDPEPHLSAFLRRVVPGNRVRIVQSKAEAQRLIERYRTGTLSVD